MASTIFKKSAVPKRKTPTSRRPAGGGGRVSEVVEAVSTALASRESSKKEELIKEKKPAYTGGKFRTINSYYKVAEGLYAVAQRNALRGVNTLLLGPTGVGKTELVANLAKELGLPLTIFDMGTMSDPIMSLVGTHVIKMEDGKTTSHFAKSRFSEVIQQPGIILLDELSR